MVVRVIRIIRVVRVIRIIRVVRVIRVTRVDVNSSMLRVVRDRGIVGCLALLEIEG
jgi:hypothetical protein